MTKSKIVFPSKLYVQRFADRDGSTYFTTDDNPVEAAEASQFCDPQPAGEVVAVYSLQSIEHLELEKTVVSKEVRADSITYDRDGNATVTRSEENSEA